MSLQLHRPDERGGLEPRPPAQGDWRAQLRSPRWGAGLRGRKLPRMNNTEMDPTGLTLSTLVWVGLAVLTFVILVVGYGSGFWQ